VQQGKRIGVIATQLLLLAMPTPLWKSMQLLKYGKSGVRSLLPIEQNRISDPYTTEVARYYLAPMLAQRIDTLVYGCTHYPT